MEHPLDLSYFMGASIEDVFFKEHFSSSNRNNFKTHLCYSAGTLLGVLVSQFPLLPLKMDLTVYFSIISCGF